MKFVDTELYFFLPDLGKEPETRTLFAHSALVHKSIWVDSDAHESYH